jgi:hypothetical protein
MPEPSVQALVACPDALVRADVGLTVPPPVTTAKVTVALSIGSPALFLTETDNDEPRAAPAAPRRVSVLLATIVLGTTSFGGVDGSDEPPHAATITASAHANIEPTFMRRVNALRIDLSERCERMDR